MELAIWAGAVIAVLPIGIWLMDKTFDRIYARFSWPARYFITYVIGVGPSVITAFVVAGILSA